MSPRLFVNREATEELVSDGRMVAVRHLRNMRVSGVGMPVLFGHVDTGLRDCTAKHVLHGYMDACLGQDIAAKVL